MTHTQVFLYNNLIANLDMGSGHKKSLTYYLKSDVSAIIYIHW